MCVGDVEASPIGVLPFIVQTHVDHHPPPLDLHHPDRWVGVAASQAPAVSATGGQRLLAELPVKGDEVMDSEGERGRRRETR